MPKFSIITCTHNSEELLKKNLVSVNRQSFKDFEHLFIDGQSTDDTKNIINKYKKETPFEVKLYEFPAEGISNAFNKGIEKARGEYLFFLNSDDYFYDAEALKDVHEFLSGNNLDWIYGKIRVLDESQAEVGVFPERKLFQISNSYLLKFINYIPHQATFIKSNIFKRFGKFKEDFELNMDTEYWMRISNKTNWEFYDRVVACYRIGGGESSSVVNKKKNLRYLEKAQSLHLNKIEMPFAKLLNRIVQAINITYR